MGIAGGPRVGHEAVYERVVEVLGSPEKATAWLRRENAALGGAVPLDLLSTESGIEQVLTILGRLEYGIYS